VSEIEFCGTRKKDRIEDSDGDKKVMREGDV